MTFSLLRPLTAATTILVLLPVAACDLIVEDINYEFRAANYGSHGIIITDPPFRESSQEKTVPVRIYPGIPEAPDDFKNFEPIKSRDNLESDNITLTWQLAELNNCQSLESYDLKVERNSEEITYFRKHGCEWLPIKSQIFHQELDMESIRSSEAYRRTGDYVEGNPLAGTYTLRIFLIFNEGTLRVEARNGKTMGFMQ